MAGMLQHNVALREISICFLNRGRKSFAKLARLW
jgi:hypothetical protein